MTVDGELAELPSPTLLDLALADHQHVSASGTSFVARPPDDETARLLVDAFREGRAPAWLAAYLLGCLRGPTAYDLVLGILEDDARQLSESYAGPALAKISGPAARPDLLRVMRDGKHQRNREGALLGLGVLRDGSVVDAILSAVRDRRVRAHAAASVVGRLDLSDAVLARWLASADDAERAVAIEAAAATLSAGGGGARAALAHAVQEALATGRVKLAPWVRRSLEERTSGIVRAR